MILTPEIMRLLIASTALGLVISYAWWTRLRVMYFRQDLFEIRDALWMEAKKAGSLNDPTYRQIREVLNAMISSAAYLSLPAILFSLQRAGSKKTRVESTAPSAIQKPLAEAKVKIIIRVLRYVLWDRPFSGLVLMPFLAIFYGGFYFVKKYTDRWLRSDGPFFLSDLAARATA